MCSKPQLEFLTQLLLFNFTKHLTTSNNNNNNNNSDSSNDQNIFTVSVENTSPLEPPTPPRTPIIASQNDAAQNHRNHNATTTPIDSTRTNDQQNANKSPKSVNNDGECATVMSPSRPSSPWSNVSQSATAPSTSSITVAPASKLMDTLNADRRSRTSSMNDTTTRGDDNSDQDEQEEDDEDNSSATHAFDLSFQYNDDSNGSGSGEDQGSEGGTTINSFEFSMARKDNLLDRSNDVSFIFKGFYFCEVFIRFLSASVN